MPTATPVLDEIQLTYYVRRCRSARRVFSRDLARKHPIPPKRAQYGAVARWVNKRRPLSERIDGQMVALGPKVPRSGQARVNAKRKQRAEFWRTVKVHVHPDVEQPFRQHLHLLGDGTRVHRRRALDWAFLVELDVHIPGAPADAVKAEPVYGSTWTGRESVPFLMRIDWYAGDGRRIDPIADEFLSTTGKLIHDVRAEYARAVQRPAASTPASAS